MLGRRNAGRIWLIVAVGALALTAGCKKKIPITQYPPFFTEEMRGMPVMVYPFQSGSGVADSGPTVTSQFTNAMMGNPTYKVYTQNDLKLLLDEADRQAFLTGGDANEAARKLKKLGKVDGIITGSVTTYAATSNTRREPQYNYDKNGNRYLVGYREITRNEANVALTARLIGTDGQTIHATSVPVRGTVAVEGSPAPMDPYQALAQASQQAIGQLVEEFCIVQKIVEVKEEDALKTASAFYDGQWIEQDKFTPQDDRMHVVVALPAECDRNRFKIVIARKQEDKKAPPPAPLAEVSLVWDRNTPPCGKGWQFSPAQLAEKGGLGKYEVKFYSGLEPVLRREFEIEPAKP